MEVGIRIGRGAHNLFPGGIEIDNPPWDNEVAAERTQTLMADPSVPAIFEAAFEFDDIRIRVDVLERLPRGAWGLREVKSSTSVKEASRHLEDVAVQVYVLEGCGLRVSSAELIHVDNAYVKAPGDIDWAGLLMREELIERAREYISDIGPELMRQKTLLRKRTPPTAAPSKALCLNPYQCDHWENCTADKPDDWVAHLYRSGPAQLLQFQKDGIEAVSEIPEDYSLNANQGTMRRVWVTGEPYVSPDLSKALTNFGPPAFYLDFETVNPAIPLYDGSSPYQQVPFQWSIHHVDEKGGLRHWEFLAKGAADPRRELAETMLDVLEESEDPILAYNAAFEKRMISDMGLFLPDLAKQLEALNSRMLDLLPIARGYTYFPDYRFSFSLKTVGPALAPDIDYDALEGASQGQEASALFERISSGNLQEGESEEDLRQGLLEYCKLDTLALVKVHTRLIELASET